MIMSVICHVLKCPVSEVLQCNKVHSCFHLICIDSAACRVSFLFVKFLVGKCLIGCLMRYVPMILHVCTLYSTTCLLGKLFCQALLRVVLGFMTE